MRQLKIKHIKSPISELNDIAAFLKSTVGQSTRYYDTENLGLLLHVSTRTINNWRKSNKIEFLKVGPYILYSEDHVLRFFENGKKRINNKYFTLKKSKS